MHFKNELLNELTCFCLICELLQQYRQNHTVRLYLPQFSKLLYPCKAKLLMESVYFPFFQDIVYISLLLSCVVYLPSRVYSKLLYPCKARFQWNQYISLSSQQIVYISLLLRYVDRVVVMLCTHSLFVSQQLHSFSFLQIFKRNLLNDLFLSYFFVIANEC